jgi:S1-C subfamily serine protease
VSGIDLAALGLIAVMAVVGARRGLVAGLLSLAAVVVGAIAGSRIAPHLLSGGAHSPYTPIAALVGALVVALLLQVVAGAAGAAIRSSLRTTPFRAIDSVGGLLFGGLTALAFVWVAAAAILLLPHQLMLRNEVQRSTVVRGLVTELPPRRILHALAVIDPFPTFAGPPAPAGKPDPRVLTAPAIGRVAGSVVKIESIACGIGYTGSGWVVRDGLVVTAAHVVAGASRVFVTRPDGISTPAVPVLFDGHNDLALLSSRDIGLPPLRLADPREGSAGILLGYPGGGAFTRIPVRVGRTSAFLARDYRESLVWRTITSLRATIRPGDSGGPLLNPAGRVEGTVFARKEGEDVGYATPTEVLRKELAKPLRPVSTGTCIP